MRINSEKVTVFVSEMQFVLLVDNKQSGEASAVHNVLSSACSEALLHYFLVIQYSLNHIKGIFCQRIWRLPISSAIQLHPFSPLGLSPKELPQSCMCSRALSQVVFQQPQPPDPCRLTYSSEWRGFLEDLEAGKVPSQRYRTGCSDTGTCFQRVWGDSLCIPQLVHCFQ